MFADARTAARIDRAEARLSLDLARAIPGAWAREIGGGAAVHARPRSPINKLIGAGFDGALDAAELAEVEAACRGRGEGVRAELSELADPAALAQLVARGYRLTAFENVLGLAPGAAAASESAVAVTIVDDLADWALALVEGFAHPDGTGAGAEEPPREVIEEVMTDFARAPGFRRYVARLDGRLAGAATMRIDDGVAQLCGAATLPGMRRRGVQAALSAARLRDAAAAGCDVATVTTAPGSQSQANSQRRGFALLYARAVLVLPGPDQG